MKPMEPPLDPPLLQGEPHFRALKHKRLGVKLFQEA